MAFTACDDNFDDWAAPSTNDPVEAAAAYGISFTGSGVDVDMNDENRPESIRLVGMTASSDDVESITVRKVTVNDANIPTTISGNDVYVTTAQLDSTAQAALKSRKYEKRNLSVKVDATAILKSGEAVAVSGEVQQNETPIKTPAVDANGYYMLGNINDNDWTPSKAVWMDKESDGVYSVVVTTTGSSNWFKFYGGSHYSATNNWDEVNQSQLGCAVNGDESTFNYVEWLDVQTAVIAGAGKWKVTLDVNNWTYTVEPSYSELYMTGSNYGWGGTWNKLTPINGVDGEYWGIFYLHADEQFKFAPQAGWGNDFGGEATINDEAGAGLVADGTNLKTTNAGWYLLHIVNGAERKVNVLKPNVYLMGDAAGEWAINESHKFTVPTTDNGEFVSPEFASDCELRMCVSLVSDWWRTEFMVFDGKIVFRGNDGDQERVKVSKGQRAYLNFTSGTGSIK